MPFPMTHLAVAYDCICQNKSAVSRPEQFLLGALAPDSVHFRPNYEKSMKKTSHLFEGCGEWGVTEDPDLWYKNIMAFLEKWKDFPEQDFIRGYAAHVLTDWVNDRVAWTPYRENTREEFVQGIDGDSFHREMAAWDYEIYLNFPGRAEIWKLLEKAESHDIPGRIVGKELNDMKTSVLYEQYENRERKEGYSNTIWTPERKKCFWEKAQEVFGQALV